MKSVKVSIPWLLLIAIVAVTALPPAKKAEVRRNIRQCSAEADVLTRDSIKVLKGDFKNNGDNMKQFVVCMFRKIEFLGDDDEFDEDIIREKLSENIEEDEVNTLMDKCAITKDKLTDTCWERFKCFFKNHKVPSDMMDF
uniref:B1 protein n=1 Tax=Culex pipiens TaxID=7175 RepID=A0A8D8HGN9_CULPI